MEFNVVDLSSSEKEVEIKLQYDEIKKEIEEEVKKQAKKIQIPGFRKGKAPLSMLKKMYGDAFEYEASEKVANSFFWKIADEKQLKPIGQPEMTDLKFEPEKDLSFKVKFETIPTLNVKDYKNLTFEIPDLIVNENEIQKEIDYILKANKELEDAEEIIDEKFVIDAEVLLVEKNGEKIPDTIPEKMQIDLTADGISKEIVKNSRNKKVGESFNFVFKDEHTHKHDDGTEEVHKEEYNYDVKILGLKKIIYPELNEELIKKVTRDKVSTEADLREEIKKDIQSYYDNQTEEMIRIKLISEILKKNDFVPPRSLVNNILNEYVKNEEEQAKKSKYPFNKEEARNRLEKSAENEVKWYLIKNEIQKAENILLTDQDLNELAESESVKTGLPVDKLINYYKSSNQGERILDKKLFDFLKSNNTIVKVDADKLKSKQEVKDEK
ncbi:MAG TPA: trigger factor [Ignavibacteriaceae bacterium]|jgi:trigger factor|nr:MAG: Trigger factor [Ignavibacteria bacterium ADurb.Bin266]OQY73188.1 MAG: trigger factor [Ignavibacteriales bacterium UTCHB2]HQF43027.1 trigger factor [Ignavibacteriaceae bacterium]HQI41072.1 trigger factor [Ignavibacteriaceae bacterium]